MNQAQQDEVRSKLGVNIRRRREELGLSQEQLANRAEMGAAHLGNIERGSSRNNPTMKTPVATPRILTQKKKNLPG